MTKSDSDHAQNSGFSKMTDEERDQAIQIVAKIALEAQTWAAALKEVLVVRGLTTDEEFKKFVAAAESETAEDPDEAGS